MTVHEFWSLPRTSVNITKKTLQTNNILGRSSLREREMSNFKWKIWSIFVKLSVLFLLPLKDLGKTRLWFLPPVPFLVHSIWFFTFLIISTCCVFYVERHRVKTSGEFLTVRATYDWDMQWPNFLVRSVWCCSPWRSSRMILGGMVRWPGNCGRRYTLSFSYCPGVWWLVQL